jgi:hypothetical protein
MNEITESIIVLVVVVVLVLEKRIGVASILRTGAKLGT